MSQPKQRVLVPALIFLALWTLLFAGFSTVEWLCCPEPVEQVELLTAPQPTRCCGAIEFTEVKQ